MKTTMLADRYALALRGALGQTDELEGAAKTLDALGAFYASETSLRNVLGNSALDMDGRRKILDGILDAYEAPETVRRLLHTMLDHNRMALLPAVASRFENHLDEWFNRVEVTVVTATPLTPELESRLVASLERFTHKTVRMKKRVNPNIVGGFIVHMYDVFFDFSLRSRLDRLREKLLAEEVLNYAD
ncbi:MAG: F-type H+-transporting ATPase subunit delta [Candidatus Hydrogenedentes bacterium]|nr:F-type H+-transporting ATPase subunit delta [Candidatus Hydrogenedentota bacterium]